MNKKLLILCAVLTFMFITSVQGQIFASIILKDANQNVIDNATIRLGSNITIVCGYNSNGAGNAKAKLAVSINDLSYTILVQNQSMTTGQTFIYVYKPSIVGNYTFRWTCKLDNGDECAETTQVRTQLTLAISEPSTITAIISFLSATIIVFIKRRNKRR